ncbi:MAG: hypothetical protein J6Y05_10025, partial [Bacteroidales bacterium]|nr:hypothetical protein [Bacteroidales bacterium]
MKSIRKLLLLAFAFVSLATSMKAQTSWLETLGIDFDFDVPKPVVTYKDLIGVGSARHMTGNICVLYLFVGTETSQWSQDEIEATAQKLYAAEDWLKAEALRYGKKVEFHNYSIKRQLTDNNIPSDPFKPDAVNYPKTVLRRFGYSSNRELHDILSRKTNCQQFLV